MFDWSALKDNQEHARYEKAVEVLLTLEGKTPNAIIKYLYYIEIICAAIQEQRSHIIPKKGVLDIFSEGKTRLSTVVERRDQSFWTSRN